MWELFGNCLGIVWELFGNCLGIVWEFGGDFWGEWKKNEKKSVKMFFSTKIVFYICTQEI
jgi:hypothetical protein